MLQISFANNKYLFMTRDKNLNICRNIVSYKRKSNHHLIMTDGRVEIDFFFTQTFYRVGHTRALY